MDLRLMYPRCLLLHSNKRYEEFVDCTEQVLFGHFKSIFRRAHLNLIMSNRSIKHRLDALRHLMGTGYEQIIRKGSIIISGASITTKDMWDLFIKLCEVLIDIGKVEKFLDVSCSALIYPPFMNDAELAQDCDFVCMVACLLNKNGHYAYNFIRDICVKQMDNTQAWNLFGQIISMSQDIRHNRFCLRLMLKHQDHLALGILNGHNAMVAGTYKHALGEYVMALRQDAKNPLISLCIGMTFIHMASQKFASRRHSLIIQACAFLNQYIELRGECQETYYNCGRAMHQIGLLHAAIYYYQKALEFGPVIPEEPELFDLSKDIAFNLSLIYRNSGSDDLAAMLTHKYLVF